MDIQSNSNLGNRVSNTAKRERLKDLCAQFESFFYHMILKAGRSSSIESDLIKKSKGEEIFTNMLDSKIAEIAAENTSGGLKEILFNYLEKKLPDDSKEMGKKFPTEINAYQKKSKFYSNIKENKADVLA